VQQRGRFVPTEPCATEPLAPLSRSFSVSRLSRLHESCVLAACPRVSTRVGAGRKTEEPPRSPSRAPRERNALEATRDAFHHQGPFPGSGGHYDPGPATTSPFSTMVPPLNDGLPPFWALGRSSPLKAGESDPRQRFRSTRLPTVRPADPRSELGPCSLDPAALFGARLPSLFETNSSPDDFCNCVRRASNQPELVDPRRDGGRDLLPVLTRHAAPLRERWRAASRASSIAENPGVGSSCLRRFARPRCLRRCLTIRACARDVAVRWT